MITSLNVNNFVGKEEWMKLQGDSIKKKNIWNEQKEYYFNYIKNHLISDEDVVILHEIPYIKEKAYSDKCGETKYKRTVIKEIDVQDEHKSEIFNELLAFCIQNGFEMLISNSDETSFFITVAICKENMYQVDDTGFKSYKRRVVLIEKKVNPEEIIIGVHAKDAKYWEQLINLFILKNKDSGQKKIIIIGDLNVFVPGTAQKKLFYELLSKGLFDVWIEMGNSNFDSTYARDGIRTRIDYGLVSDNGFNSYKMFKDDSVRVLGRSDHSAIILKCI